jgi:hypothetical protein
LGIQFSWICNTTAIIRISYKVEVASTAAPWKDPQHNICNGHKDASQFVEAVGIHFSLICNTTKIKIFGCLIADVNPLQLIHFN